MEGMLFREKELLHVARFKYFGMTLIANYDYCTDIRIRTALKAMSDLDYIWKNKTSRMRPYRSLILLVAFYGCESWTLRSAEEKQLLEIGMATLRKIFGICIKDKMRNNNI